MEEKKPVTRVRKWAPVITSADEGGDSSTATHPGGIPSLDVSVVSLDWKSATSLRRSPSGASGIPLLIMINAC